MTEYTETRTISESISLAYVLAALLNGALVVAKETSTTVHEAMAGATGHHWSAQAVILLVVLVAGTGFSHYSGLPRRLGLRIRHVSLLIIMSTLVSFAIIAGFYLIHYINAT